jgi:hypothetical protein
VRWWGRISVVGTKKGACRRAADVGYGFFLLLHVEVWQSCEEGVVAFHKYQEMKGRF